MGFGTERAGHCLCRRHRWDETRPLRCSRSGSPAIMLPVLLGGDSGSVRVWRPATTSCQPGISIATRPKSTANTSPP